MTESIGLWVGFIIFILAMLALDLGVFHRKAHEVKVKEAIAWSIFWVVLSLLFNVCIYFWFGSQKALEFLTGYLIEKSLSVDNIFVFLLIFSYFQIPSKYQHRILFWGILGALIMRGIFIAAGVSLIHRLEWIIYVFGVFLIYTGFKMAMQKGQKVHPEKNPVLKLARKYFPVAKGRTYGKLFLRENGKLVATPLFLVLLLIETTDVVFAVDSIPAILAITIDPFIVFTSNVFAILGLRALYFALAGIIQWFHYLHYGLSVVLIFVGIKMTLSDIYHIPITISLGLIAGILILSVGASLIWPEEESESE